MPTSTCTSQMSACYAQFRSSQIIISVGPSVLVALSTQLLDIKLIFFIFFFNTNSFYSPLTDVKTEGNSLHGLKEAFVSPSQQTTELLLVAFTVK